MLHLREVCLILFAQARVVTSTTVARTLMDLGEVGGLPCIAFANDATSEAREALVAAKVSLLTLRDFGWNDESYNRVRMGRPH